MLWLVLWLSFPYNRLRRGSTTPRRNLAGRLRLRVHRRRTPLLSASSPTRGTLRLRHRQGPHRRRLVVLPLLSPPVPQPQLRPRPQSTPTGTSSPSTSISSVGSIFGGSLSGWRMNRGHSVNTGRKFAMLIMAALRPARRLRPPHERALPHQRLARHAAHRARRRRPPGLVRQPLLHPRRHVPLHRRLHRRRHRRSRRRSRRRCLHLVVKHNLSLHQLLVFSMAAGAYLVALAIFHLLVPRLGASIDRATPVQS